MAIRDRVKELRRVRAGDLQENAANWRRHPKAQVDALAGVISEIGFAGALIAYEGDDGTLTLIDGHMRAGVSADQELPVVVLDVNEDEAKKLLATYDPIGAMAQTDTDALMSLLGDATFKAEPVNAMLEALANGEVQPLPNPTGWMDELENAGGGYQEKETVNLTFVIAKSDEWLVQQAIESFGVGRHAALVEMAKKCLI